MLKVLKFGGSSMADAHQLEKVRSIVEADPARRVVVVSAAGKRFKDDHKITDLLYLCHAHLQYGVSCDGIFDMVRSRYLEIRDELGLTTPLEAEFDALRAKMDKGISADELVSRGEYFAARIMADCLGFDFLDSSLWLHFRMDGTVDQEASYQALVHAASGRKVVIPGFYGVLPDGSIHTFSRGGSDITGALAAAALDADVYENWTDVSGVLAADPRIIEHPHVVDYITYRELRELSYMGASVLHEDAVFPVRRANIPINIRNTNRPQDPGTFIVPTLPANAHKRKVTGIAGHKGFSSVYVEKSMMNGEIGFVAHLLQIFADHGISFEHCPSGIDTVSIIVSTEALAPAREEILRRIQDELQPDHVSVEDGLALIAVVGQGMIYAKGTAARIFRVIADANINIRMIDQGSCELNIIIAVKETDYELAIRSLYHAVERVM